MNPLHSSDVMSFASDNYAGAHPQILAALAAANGGTWRLMAMISILKNCSN